TSNKSRKQPRHQLESPDERQRGRSDQQSDRAVPVRQPRQTVDAARPEQKCERNSPHPDLPVCDTSRPYAETIVQEPVPPAAALETAVVHAAVPPAARAPRLLVAQ